MNVVIAGDYYPGLNPDIESINRISNDIRSLCKDVDYSIVNFESPISSKCDSPINKFGPCLKTTEDAAKALKRIGFDCATLANNHVMDQGEESLLHTIDVCRDLELDTVGAGKNLHDATKTLYKEINGEILAIINCCEHEFSIATDDAVGANPLNPIQQYYDIQEARKNADYVLVIVHGGHEGYNLPSPRMQETYRFFIDAGADAVVNHHQHCFSGFEIYKDKYIFYGLGNYYFPKENIIDDIWNKGFILELQFEKNNKSHVSLIPYLQSNGEPNFELLHGEKYNVFNSEIEALNKIISNPDQLKKSHKEWMKQYSGMYLLALSPYSNRYLRALLSRKLLPAFLSKDRIARFINYIDCESHRDRMIEALKNKLKSYN